MKNKNNAPTTEKVSRICESNRRRLQRILRQMLANGFPAGPAVFCVPGQISQLQRRVIE